MTSTNHNAPSVSRLRYESAATPTGSFACPHCGGTFDLTETEPVPVVARPEVRIVPPVVTFDVAPVRVPVARVLGMLLEVIDGRRPAEQLREVAAPEVLRYARAARPSRRPERVARVLSLRVCRPAEQAVEAAAVVALGARVRAVAARFEGIAAARWRCVAIRIL